MQNLTVDALLDRVREAQGLKSDYQMAKATGFSIQKIGNWRHGRVMPDEKACQALAVAANLDPDVVIAQVHALRTKDSAARAIWERIAERLQMSAAHALAAVFAVLFAMGLGAQDARAAGTADVHDPAAQGVKSLYIVSSVTGLICVMLFWLLARFDRGFVPCFAPAK